MLQVDWGTASGYAGSAHTFFTRLHFLCGQYMNTTCHMLSPSASLLQRLSMSESQTRITSHKDGNNAHVLPEPSGFNLSKLTFITIAERPRWLEVFLHKFQPNAIYPIFCLKLDRSKAKMPRAESKSAIRFSRWYYYNIKSRQ
jgi:hypothetical protein